MSPLLMARTPYKAPVISLPARASRGGKGWCCEGFRRLVRHRRPRMMRDDLLAGNAVARPATDRPPRPVSGRHDRSLAWYVPVTCLSAWKMLAHNISF